MVSAVPLLKDEIARRGLRIAGAALAEPATRRFELAAIQGRIVELSAGTSSAALTAALVLVGEAQRKGETAAWLTARGASFFPPDAAALGIDLAALVVVRVPEAQDVARAADRLARSGGFGMVVLDLGATPATDNRQPTTSRVPVPLLSRLGALAQRHNMAVVFLTKGDAAGSLGSLVSLRAEVVRRRAKSGRFAVSVEVVKDKRAGPGWRHVEVFYGPAGLR
ncbi:MAG: recombinase A [Deltaproteobacteria bacterium]|nr:recombinase A [Deltaproteobacteria bacterium]